MISMETDPSRRYIRLRTLTLLGVLLWTAVSSFFALTNPLHESFHSQQNFPFVLVEHFLIWALGVMGILFATVTIRKRLIRQDRAEIALIQSEQFAHATIDALPAHICVLEETGRIIAVNQAWRTFARANAKTQAPCLENANYLTVCDQAAGDNAKEAPVFAEAIRAIIQGQRDDFLMEYPCHSPTEQRWFVGRVARFPGDNPAHVVVAHENITFRKQMEEALRESEMHYRELFNRMSDGVAIYTARQNGQDFIIKDINLAGEQICSVKRMDIIGRSVLEVFPGIQDIGMLDALYRVWKTGRQEQLESSLYSDDRIRLWVHNKIYKLPSGEIVAVFSDMTQNKEAEQSIRHLSSFPELNPNPVLEVDRCGNIIYSNPASRTVLEKLGVRAVETFLPPDLPELIESAAKNTPALFYRELEINGHFFAETLSFEPTFDTMRLYVTDITERKRSENNLRETKDFLENLVNYANAPIIVWDPLFKITRFNHAFERLTGYTADAVLGRPLNLLFPEDTKTASLEKISSTLSGERWESVEIPILCQDGTIRIALWNSANLYANDGKTLVATIAQGQDITERKQAEQALHAVNLQLEQRVRERTAELEATNRELEAFSYSVSHDLRAPLRAIDGFSLALAEDTGNHLDDLNRHYLERVRSATQRMGLLIDDLLKLSRVTRTEMSYTQVNLSEIARRTASEIQEHSPQRVVEWVIAPDLIVQGDQGLLETAMRNLLDNAAKFTGQRDDARIEFGAGDIGGYLTYWVRDNGAGFNMTYAGKLFGAFQRLHNTAEFEGTGIGLATVQRIIHRHGGRIWAEGAVGQGAAFYFTLPSNKVTTEGSIPLC